MRPLSWLSLNRYLLSFSFPLSYVPVMIPNKYLFLHFMCFFFCPIGFSLFPLSLIDSMIKMMSIHIVVSLSCSLLPSVICFFLLSIGLPVGVLFPLSILITFVNSRFYIPHPAINRTTDR